MLGSCAPRRTHDLHAADTRSRQPLAARNREVRYDYRAFDIDREGRSLCGKEWRDLGLTPGSLNSSPNWRRVPPDYRLVAFRTSSFLPRGR